MATHDLEWITFDRLVDIMMHRLGKSIARLKTMQDAELFTDPTLTIVRSYLTDMPLSQSRHFDEGMSITRTLQNAIGLIHQDILSSVSGWENMGTTGGVIDLRSTEPVALAGNCYVLAEIKMRHNTIKSSDEKGVFDSLKMATSMGGNGKNIVGYLIQIIPKNRIAYDKPWKVSGRPENNKVRAVDGVTGYHLVTGDPNALFDLLRILPRVMEAVIEKCNIPTRENMEELLKLSAVNQLMSESLPERSALLDS